MSKVTEAEIQKDIERSQAETKRLQEALEGIQKMDKLPLAFMANHIGTPRLCIRVTKDVKKAVAAGAEYITLCAGGYMGSHSADAAYVKERYDITEAIFD